MDRQIRVLVADPVKLMREVMIAAFADQPDIEVVGEAPEESQILPLVNETQPDFLFIGLDNPERPPAICETIFRLHPHIHIIAVGAHSNRSVRYWASYNIHSSPLESSEEAILHALRKKRAFAGEAS